MYAAQAACADDRYESQSMAMGQSRNVVKDLGKVGDQNELSAGGSESRVMKQIEFGDYMTASKKGDNSNCLIDEYV